MRYDKLTIHHVARSDHVSSSLGVRDRNLGDPLDATSIVDRAVVAPQFPTMSMIGIFAQTNIARNDEIRESFAYELSGENDGGVGVVGRAAARVLLHVEGNAKEDDRFQSARYEGSEERFELVDSPSFLSGQRMNLHLRIQRVNFSSRSILRRFRLILRGSCCR